MCWTCRHLQYVKSCARSQPKLMFTCCISPLLQCLEVQFFVHVLFMLGRWRVMQAKCSFFLCITHYESLQIWDRFLGKLNHLLENLYSLLMITACPLDEFSAPWGRHPGQVTFSNLSPDSADGGCFLVSCVKWKLGKWSMIFYHQ